MIALAVKKAGYKLGKEIFIALDVASSEFYNAKTKKYEFKKSDGSKRNAKQMVEFYQDLKRNTQSFLSKMVVMKTTGLAGNY